MTRPSRILLSMALALGLAGSACTGEKPAASAPARNAANVETANAVVRDVDVELNAVGTVRATEQAEIRPQVDGVIAEILYEEGARVDEGELLVRLDDRKATAKLELARASLDSARAKEKVAKQRLDRHRQLIADRLVSEDAFESVEAEYVAAAAAVREQAAAVELAARELDDYHLRAPFSGTVGARLVDVGNYVAKGTELVVLLETDPVEITFRVPDRDVSSIAVGNAVEIKPSDRNGAIRGAVSFIDPQVDATTRMLSVRATVPNADKRLRHGQFVEVSILVDVRRAQVVIPEEAILSAGGNTWVFVVEEGRAKRRDVALGSRMPPEVEVLSGVAADDLVVIGGQHRLTDGAEVDVLPAAGRRGT